MRGRGRKIRKLKLISLSNTVNSRLAWPQETGNNKTPKNKNTGKMVQLLDSFVQSLVPTWGKKNLLLDLKCYGTLLRWRMCTNTH